MVDLLKRHEERPVLFTTNGGAICGTLYLSYPCFLNQFTDKN